MNWELIFKLAVGVIGLGTAAVVAINQVSASKHKKLEAAAQAAGLSANPARCMKHEDRMSAIESVASGVASGASARFDGLERQLDGVASDVKSLISLHLR
jgi:hypothetical protein